MRFRLFWLPVIILVLVLTACGGGPDAQEDEETPAEEATPVEEATETEVEALIRLGVGYGFPVSASAAVGPIAMVDHAGDRWTSLFALGMAVGF